MLKFICSECGSEDVSSKCWANPNNDEIYDYVSNDVQDNYCNDCKEHVKLLTVEKIS